MIRLDEIRAGKLIELARERYKAELSAAEEKILRDSASSETLPEPEKDAPRPEVSAEFLRWLATDLEAAEQIDPKGIRVYSATIPCSLDLDECTVARTLDFRFCTFKDEINLISATTRGIYFIDSFLTKGIRADCITANGQLFLTRTESKGVIHLHSAEIKGNLLFSGAKLTAEENALIADGARIGGSVLMNVDTTTKQRFKAAGTIHLKDTDIRGIVLFSGAKLAAKENALIANRAQIGGSVFMDVDKTTKQRFEATGTIQLMDAEIHDIFVCSGAKLKAKHIAFAVDRATIHGALFLRCDETTKYSFESQGMVRLNGAVINGALDCSGAKLKAKGIALYADRVKIGGGVFFRSDKTSQQGFECAGAINFTCAEINKGLIFYGVKIDQVICHNTVIREDLTWLAIEYSSLTYLDLTGVMVKNLRDDKESWPKEGNLNLDGLEYEELTLHARPTPEEIENCLYSGELQLRADERIEWILRQPLDVRSEPQPWMQLRSLLERKGDHKSAKHALFKLHCLQTQKNMFLLRCGRIALAWIEENPLRILLSLTTSILLGTLIFCGASRSGAMMQTVRILPNGEVRPVSEHYPVFQPFVYSLENGLPIVKLGMDERWVPDPKHEPRPWFPNHPWLDGLKWLNAYWFLAITRWLLILSGWVQATVLVVAVSDRFKK